MIWERELPPVTVSTFRESVFDWPTRKMGEQMFGKPWGDRFQASIPTFREENERNDAVPGWLQMMSRRISKNLVCLGLRSFNEAKHTQGQDSKSPPHKQDGRENGCRIRQPLRPFATPACLYRSAQSLRDCGGSVDDMPGSGDVSLQLGMHDAIEHHTK